MNIIRTVAASKIDTKIVMRTCSVLLPASVKIRIFDAVCLAAKWDSMAALNINIVMTKNRKHSLPKNMCDVYFRCVYKFGDVRAGVVVISVMLARSLSLLFTLLPLLTKKKTYSTLISIA